MSSEDDHRERILVWAPTVRDGEIAREILGRHGIAAHASSTVEELCDAIGAGAGAALIAEERLSAPAAARLAATLSQQPAWSDFPLIVLGVRRGRYTSEATPDLEPLGNVTLLDPPLRVRTLVRAAHSALRARRRQYEAQRAIEERDRFLAMLGHELRNPLSAISLAGTAMTSAPHPERYFGILQRQIAQLTRLVDDLLDVARVSSGKIQLVRTRVELASVIEHAVDALRARFVQAGLALEVSLAPCTVDGDPARLEQIFGNLLTNAIKYTPPGGRVSVRSFTEGAHAVAVVEDTGVGIEASMLPAIFEQFVQVESSLDRSQGGMGVGLSLVRTLVALHGGSVHAESDGRGRGSRFSVRIPLAVERSVASATCDQAQPPEGGRERTLVIVEDNADARELLMMALEQMGYRVRAAADGARGLELVVQSEPDAAIVDIGLPLMDGYEVAQRVRVALGDRVRLIALTGYGQLSDRKRAFEAGFDEHLTKPADLRRLGRLLDELLPAAADSIAGHPTGPTGSRA